MMISPVLEAIFDFFEVRIALRERRIKHLQPLARGQFKSAGIAMVASSDGTRLARLSYFTEASYGSTRGRHHGREGGDPDIDFAAIDTGDQGHTDGVCRDARRLK
jgi:hypothetical protein